MSLPVSICIPVLKRYDLLERLLLSLHGSSVEPDAIHIVNNGKNDHALSQALVASQWNVSVRTPIISMGVAESWNYFIDRVPENRIIVNDDVVFGVDSIAQIVDTEGDIVGCITHNDFSCFLIRDTCVQKVGLFDESISPGYAYFEDCDYEERIRKSGAIFKHVSCGLTHEHSATLKSLTSSEAIEHHRKFIIAQENFFNKYGRLPEGVERQSA